MANNWSPDLDDDDDDDGDGQNQQNKRNNDPKSLRAYLRKVEKEKKDLETLVAEFNANARRGAIEKTLAEKKLPTKLAGLIPADVTADKVDAWLEEYKELFTPPKADDGQGDQDDGDADEWAREQDVQALQRLARASNSAMPATRATDLMADLKDPNLTPEKLIKMINDAGGGYGSG